MSSGYFESWTNKIASRPTDADRHLVRAVEAASRAVLGQANVQWGGSNSKRTAIVGSDLDLFVLSNSEVTSNQRRSLAQQLERSTGHRAEIKSHAIRLHSQPKVDISFGTSMFGQRSVPQRGEFFSQPHRQQAVRALKFWSRRSGLPEMKGWVAEAFVAYLDQQSARLDGLGLFLKVLDWFANRANPGAVESVLRPLSQFPWAEQWSAQVPGRLEAFRNDARRLLRRNLTTSPLRSEQDVENWILNR